ncbi:hypothetical protein RDABS01_009440 [Bienertia sinuspersici]
MPKTTARRKGLLTGNLYNDEDDLEYNMFGQHNDTSSDDEDDLQLSDVHEMVVMDNYDPYADDIQDDGEGNYFAKLYKNFWDKQQLRDVVRDYCIQSGFAVVVAYSVYCSAEGCEWRLQASRLLDGFNWEIKSI